MNYRLNPKAKSALVDSLMQYKFSLLMTVTFPMTDIRMPRLDYNQRCIRYARVLFKRLNFKLYGKKANVDLSRRLQHITFFEDRTRRDDPTAFHAHSAIVMPEKERSRFEYHIGHQLPKIYNAIGLKRQSPKPDFRNIDQPENLLDYVSKFSNSDYDILCELPTLGNAIPV